MKSYVSVLFVVVVLSFTFSTFAAEDCNSPALIKSCPSRCTPVPFDKMAETFGKVDLICIIDPNTMPPDSNESFQTRIVEMLQARLGPISRVAALVDGKIKIEMAFRPTGTVLSPVAEQRAELLKQRSDSMQRLRKLGTCLFLYANDYNEAYPPELLYVKPYLRDANDYEWLIQNVTYLGNGKSLIARANEPIAYDKTLLNSYPNLGTNVLYNDSHVEFQRPPTIAKLIPSPVEVEAVVYVTKAGKRYHKKSCRFLNESAKPMSVSDAKAKALTPCAVCKP